MKTPMVKLKKNHKTQALFIILCAILIFAQIFIIVPSKSPYLNNHSLTQLMCIDQKFKHLAYIITVLSIVLLISFTMASVRDPGYLKPEFDFMTLLEKV